MNATPSKKQTPTQQLIAALTPRVPGEVCYIVRSSDVVWSLIGTTRIAILRHVFLKAIQRLHKNGTLTLVEREFPLGDGYEAETFSVYMLTAALTPKTFVSDVETAWDMALREQRARFHDPREAEREQAMQADLEETIVLKLQCFNARVADERQMRAFLLELETLAGRVRLS